MAKVIPLKVVVKGLGSKRSPVLPIPDEVGFVGVGDTAIVKFDELTKEITYQIIGEQGNGTD